MSNKIKALLITILAIFSYFTLLVLLIFGMRHYPVVGMAGMFFLGVGFFAYFIYKEILERLED